MGYPFPKRQILDSSKLKEFTDNNLKFDDYGKKFSKQVGKEKLIIMSSFSFSHSVFKTLVLQTHKNQGLFGKGLKGYYKTTMLVKMQKFVLKINYVWQVIVGNTSQPIKKILSVNNLEKIKLFGSNVWKMEKMLVSSIFSFYPHSVFYPFES